MGIIRQQSLYNVIITYAGIFLGFISLIILMPRFLSPEELGLTRILVAFATLVSSVTPLGANFIAIRYFPLFRNAKGHHGFFLFLLIFISVGVILALGLLYLFRDLVISQYMRESRLFSDYYFLVFPLIFFLSYINGFVSYCQVHLKTIYPSFLNDILIRIFTIIIVLIYHFGWISFNDFIYSFIGIYGLQLFLLSAYIFSFDRPLYPINLKAYRKVGFSNIFAYGGTLLFVSAASIGLKSIDTLLIGKFISLEGVAVYAIAVYMASIIDAPLNSVLKIVSPRLAQEISQDDWTQVGKIYHNSTAALVCVGGGIFLMIMINLKLMLSLLPADYVAAEGVIYILGTSAYANMITGANNIILLNSPHYKIGVMLQLFLFSLNIALNWVLIPFAGIVGAAVASLISTVLINLAAYMYLYRKYGFAPVNGKVLKMILPVLIILGFNAVLSDGINLWVYSITGSLLAAILYVLVMFRVYPESREWVMKNLKR